MRFLFLESFYGGSHRDFADGLAAHSRHSIDLHTLPARFWKWRMRGSALHFVRRIPDPSSYDGLFVTDLISLSDLKSLWAERCPPSLVYFHENQLSYPLPEGERMDYHFGFTDITTALAADRVLFNSRTHREAFLRDLPPFLRKLPEHRPMWAVGEIEGKSGVIYPGCAFPAEGGGGGPKEQDADPLIVWNHRWEFDKDPDSFFSALDAVGERGCRFRLALLGENFQVVPKAFEKARERYGERIVRYGYEPSKAAYMGWLRRGDIVVSTAVQENFGISIVEAIRCGCYPLLPDRLSYPELLPAEHHASCLYATREELVEKLCALLADRCGEWREEAGRLAKEMGRFSWERMIGLYDEELERLAEGEYSE